MRFKFEERGSLAVRFLSDEGGQITMPPRTWEMLGRPMDFEPIVGEVMQPEEEEPRGPDA